MALNCAMPTNEDATPLPDGPDADKLSLDDLASLTDRKSVV